MAYQRKTADLPDAIVKVVGKNRAQKFDAQDFLNAIIQEWGGIERFASDIVSDMKSASLGPTAKTRYYEMVNRLIVYVTSTAPTEAPIAEMDDVALLAATSDAVNNLIAKGALAAPSPPSDPDTSSPSVSRSARGKK